MAVLSITSHSEDQTEALAQKLALAFLPGDLVLLQGEMGSGKTTFVRALAMARGVDEAEIHSPSFAIVNEYASDPPIYHVDLYRLGDTSELTEIGWDDYLSREAIVLVEWGERAKGHLPERYYLMEFKIVSDDERQIQLSLVQS